MLAPNSVLQERYRILEIIGQGGMGAVYKAIDERLGNIVALKQTFLNDDEMARAFEREARLLANLGHPALPKVTDHFVENDGQFLIMEFIPGDDLGRQLKRRGQPFDHELVLEWGYQILDVLEYLHQHRPPIIHRDIKPQNLKLNSRGRIVLLDFGLAKGAPQLAHLEASSIFGYTLNYAPLEQIQHSGSEERSDLFSLAATLYHLMTATPPLGSLTRAAALINGDPDPLQPPHLVNSRIPPAVGRTIMQAMSLRRDDRPIGACAMREAFDEARRIESVESNVYSGSGVNQLQPGGAYASPVASIVVDASEAPTRLIESASATNLVSEKAKKTWSADLFHKFIHLFPTTWLLIPGLLLALLIFVFLMPFSKPTVPQPKAKFGPPGWDLSVPALNLPPDEAPMVEDGIVTLRWAPVQGAVEYLVENTNWDDFLKDAVSRPDPLRTTDTFYQLQLTEKSEYVRLTAVGAGQTSWPSRWQTIARKEFQWVLPAKKLIKNTDAELRWWPVLGATRYEINIGDSRQETIRTIAETTRNVLKIRIPVDASYIRIAAIGRSAGSDFSSGSGWIPVADY
jgi:serine/threonine protein kinase